MYQHARPPRQRYPYQAQPQQPPPRTLRCPHLPAHCAVLTIYLSQSTLPLPPPLSLALSPPLCLPHLQARGGVRARGAGGVGGFTGSGLVGDVCMGGRGDVGGGNGW